MLGLQNTFRDKSKKYIIPSFLIWYFPFTHPLYFHSAARGLHAPIHGCGHTWSSSCVWSVLVEICQLTRYLAELPKTLALSIMPDSGAAQEASVGAKATALGLPNLITTHYPMRPVVDAALPNRSTLEGTPVACSDAEAVTEYILFECIISQYLKPVARRVVTWLVVTLSLDPRHPNELLYIP